MDKVYTSCSPCGGTGTERVSSMVDGGIVFEDITCRSCEGSGLRSNLSLSADLIDFLNDLKEKVDETKTKCDEIMIKLNE